MSGIDWNGEGLPPVGTVCEYSERRGVIVAHTTARGEAYAIIQTDDDWFSGGYGEFSPIRTPEQIAKEEREKAIKEIAGLIGHQVGLATFLTPTEIAKKLYDAGLRLPQGGAA